MGGCLFAFAGGLLLTFGQSKEGRSLPRGESEVGLERDTLSGGLALVSLLRVRQCMEDQPKEASQEEERASERSNK
jgi:hypothetical protein